MAEEEREILKIKGIEHKVEEKDISVFDTREINSSFIASFLLCMEPL